MEATRDTPVHANWVNLIEIYVWILQRMVPIPAVAASLAVRIPGFEATVRDPRTHIDWQFTRGRLHASRRLAVVSGIPAEEDASG